MSFQDKTAEMLSVIVCCVAMAILLVAMLGFMVYGLWSIGYWALL
jgi:hypothetical protein